MYSAVIFDLGHTLFDFDADFERVVQISYLSLCQHLKKIIPDFQPDRKFQARFHEYKMKQYIQRDIDLIEMPIETILRNFLINEGINVEKLNLRPALDAKYAVTQEHWVLSEFAMTTLNKIKDMGLPIGIISNAADDKDVHNILKKSEVLPMLDMVLSSAGCGYRKPNPRIFKIAEEKWGHPLEQTIMVGNNLRADIGGGNAAGMYTIWTKELDAVGDINELQITPDSIIESLAELPNILSQLS